MFAQAPQSETISDVTGSSPVRGATKETFFVYQDKRGFFLLFGAKYSENKQIRLKTGVGTVDQTAPPPSFRISLLYKEVVKATEYGI